MQIMIDKKLEDMFKEENEHLLNVARESLQRLRLSFWGWLRTYAQLKIEAFKTENDISLCTTQFIYFKVVERQQPNFSNTIYFFPKRTVAFDPS